MRDGFAKVGSNIYMAQQGNGDVIQINPNGTFNQFIVGGLPNAAAVIANPANGHLFVASVNDSIFDVNPIAKTVTPFVTGLTLMGCPFLLMAKPCMGPTAKLAHFRFQRPVRFADIHSGFISGGIDGTASGYGKLAGNIFVNNNGGTVVEVDLVTKVQTLIASGGSRGDFVTVDRATTACC